ncbi:MAG: RDD family protein [Proteobacteria bacterium]|jgi:uncharacterized RDD family membrane protein YckC|uniref:RDD family protein n=1 Tax=SAR86 cluster bacterium TaxID=2030880 RepID=A0A937ID24_9GAMM|nr:RDD family protein [SAR86 cluster bacterium]MDA0774809.1 RDD family protein [Pseudomonadota bacterium]MDA0975932.1 RDD family protein [Pseudomonadota bacterium]MDA1036735.1 RDD family protein [Pseudomonadota bacterium]
MNIKAHKVLPLKRITASVYDFFLLLGVWFLFGSIALWLNGGEILNPWVGLCIVFVSSWGFFSYFWLNGNKTLGMAVWNIEIYSLDGGKINIKQVTTRFLINIFIFALAGIPLIQIYFSKNGLAINDTLSNTGLRKV